MINSGYHVVLGSLRYKSAPNTDFGLEVPFYQKYKNIIEFEPNINVNLNELYDTERQRAKIFRPVAKIVLLFDNRYSGKTSYVQFRDNMYFLDEVNYKRLQLTNPSIAWPGYPQYNEIDLIRTDYQIPGYTSPPNQQLIFETRSATTYNWNFFMSYAFSSTTKFMRYDDFDSNGNLAQQAWQSNEGIPFTILRSTSNGYNLITLRCPMKHGLSVGEYVVLKDTSGNDLSYLGNNIYQIYSLGNGLFGSEEYYANIYDIGYLPANFQNSQFVTDTQGTLKRMIDVNNPLETLSKYYVRQHKILTNVEDSILVNGGFEENVFNTDRKFVTSALTPDNTARAITRSGNQSYTLSFHKDIDSNGILDNQMKPLSELFFTIIHKGYFGWFYTPLNLIWPSGSPPAGLKEGYEFNITYTKSNLSTCPGDYNIPSSWWRPNFVRSYTKIPYNSYNVNGLQFIYNQSLKSGDIIDGDFCEWNDFEQTERVISRYVHKFHFNQNVFSTTDADPCSPSQNENPYGYYYYPHHSVKIRAFSDYVEEGAPSNTDFIPEYSFYSQYRKVFRWRDLYTYGYIDNTGNGVNLPFLNGVHHPYLNINFRVFPEGLQGTSIITDIDDPVIDDCE